MGSAIFRRFSPARAPRGKEAVSNGASRPGVVGHARGEEGGGIGAFARAPAALSPDMGQRAERGTVMTEWWRGGVIYQVYPRSFQDSNGDGVGDLPGITARLGHLASLGVDAVWLSPIFPSPMADMGYDVSDYTGIDPLFGTLADFDALVATGARARAEGDHRPGAVAHLRPASLVPGEPGEPRQPPVRLVRLGGPRPGRDAAEQLGVGLRRAGVGMGRAAAAVLFPQLPQGAARPELPQPRGAGRAARHHALLAGARGGRVPARHGQLLLPRPQAALQPAGGARRPAARDQPLRHAGPSPREEPEGEHRLPDAHAPAGRGIRRAHAGRRDRREGAAGGRDHGRLHPRARAAADGLLLRHAGAEVHRRSISAAGSRASSGGRRTAGRAGASPTTT